MDEDSAALTILTSSRGRNALASGNYGSVIRLVRQGLGLHQRDLASRAGYSQPTISRVEQNHLVDVVVLGDLCDALGIPRNIFRKVPVDPAVGGHSVEDMERRSLLKATLGVASAAMLPLELSDPTRGRKIGMSVVRECWTALSRLQALEETQGGAVVYELTSNMATRLRGTLATGKYSPAVGRALRQISAETAIRAGWQAFDARRPKPARQWWLEALHMCDLEEAMEGWRVGALAALAREASMRPGSGREVVELTQSAAKVPGASSAMLSLVAARESLGHALLRDERAAAAALTRAKRLLEQSDLADEPEWLRFWGPADLACHEMIAARYSGQGMVAVRAARQAVELCDPVGDSRNQALYQAYFGNSMARVGQYDEAVNVLGHALASPARAGSQRVTQELHEAGNLLASSTHPPAREFAELIDRLLLPTR